MVLMQLRRNGTVFSEMLISRAECSFWCAFAQRNRLAIVLIDAPLV